MKLFVSGGLLALALTTLIVSCASKADQPQFVSHPIIRLGPTPHYRVIDLGTIRSSNFLFPVAINNQSQIVGWEKGPQGAVAQRGFLWQEGRFTDLGLGEVGGINNHGQIVGREWPYPQTSVPPICYSYIWEKGKFSYIHPGKDDIDSDFFAIEINDKGWVLGDPRNLIWRDGAIHPIPENIVADGFNNEGDVTGSLPQGPFGTPRPLSVLLQNGHVFKMGNPPDGLIGDPGDINDQDEIIGTCMDPVTLLPKREFIWQNGRWTLLPAHTADSFFLAYAQNNLGEIVGKSGRHTGYAHAVVWRNGKVIDLNHHIAKSSGWILESAHAINDSGQIIGDGTHNGRHFRAFLLTPTR